MKQVFELDWQGGVAARHFRKIRPGTDELPWGTLDVRDLSPIQLDRARVMWTTMARNEYSTAVHFTQLLQLLLLSSAPVDLTGMAGDFLADEMRHVELCARIAMELGGGAPMEVELEAMTCRLDPALSPRQRATEVVVRVCCVGEAFSLPMLSTAMRTATHPLTRGALELIVREESNHGRLGWLYLDWIADHLDDSERGRLATAAAHQLGTFERLWQQPAASAPAQPGAAWTEVLRRVASAEPDQVRGAARAAAIDDVIAPLGRYGIVVARDAVGLE